MASKSINGIIDYKHDKYHHFDVHCLVIDLPVPVDVVDGVVKRVGDLSILPEPHDVLEEGEELSLDDKIEREQTLFPLCLV